MITTVVPQISTLRPSHPLPGAYDVDTSRGALYGGLYIAGRMGGFTRH